MPFWPGRPFRPAGAVNAAVVDEEVGRWNVGGRGEAGFVSSSPRFHPGTRVVVDVELPGTRRSASVRASQRKLLATARSAGYWRYRLCFEEGARRSPSLRGGLSTLRLQIAPSGRVVATRLLGTELRDAEVSRCLVARTREIRFEGNRGRRVELKLAVALWPGDAALPNRIPAGSEGSASELQQLGEALGALRPSVAQCYRLGLERDSGLWGRIQLRAEPGPAGRIARLTENESRFPDREVTSCVTSALEKAALPELSAAVQLAFRLGRRPEPTAESRTDGSTTAEETGSEMSPRDRAPETTGRKEFEGLDKNSPSGEPK